MLIKALHCGPSTKVPSKLKSIDENESLNSLKPNKFRSVVRIFKLI